MGTTLTPSLPMQPYMFSHHSVTLFGSPGARWMVMHAILSFKVFRVCLDWSIFRRLNKPSLRDYIQLLLKSYISTRWPALDGLVLVGLQAAWPWWRLGASSRWRSGAAWTVHGHARMLNEKIFKGICLETCLGCVSCIEARWRGNIPTFFNAVWNDTSFLFALDLSWKSIKSRFILRLF